MIWGGFLSYEVTELYFIESKLNAERYCKILKDRLLPFACAYHGIRRHYFVFFLQEGATAHTANLPRQWLEDSEVSTLPWPR